MCGIIGFFSKEGVSSNSLVLGSEKIKHRGPDGSGFIFFEINNSFKNFKKIYAKTTFKNKKTFNAGLGHRRLAIIDPNSISNQPMSYANSRYWITYNGEIYNYIELRDKLKKSGCYFKTESDTEVILAAYAKYGKKCLKMFNGMFSFVIYDSYDNKIFAARDRAGVKPFYFFQARDTFYFCSEIKGLFAFEELMRVPDQEYLSIFIQRGPQEQLRNTAFKGVKKLLAGEYFECSFSDIVSGNYCLKKWWSVNPNFDMAPFCKKKMESYVEKYNSLLEDAVRIRLRADVKIGSALSGGLDSSQIVYLVNKLNEDKEKFVQETYSNVYTETRFDKYDESSFIDLVTNDLNLSSKKAETNAKTLEKNYFQAIYHADTPPESSMMGGWNTFRLAKMCGTKVTLDGQGADEQLGGYLGYLPSWVFNNGIMNLPKNVYSLYKIHPNKTVLKSLFGPVAGFVLPSFISSKIRKLERMQKPTNQILLDDYNCSMSNLLNYADKISMAHSVESRMPFLDYRLTEFLFSIPINYKINKGWTKYLARIAAESYLPIDITWRRDKLGWPTPEEIWYKEVLFNWKIKQETRAKNFLNEHKIQLSKNGEGITGDKRLVSLGVWLQAYFKDSYG